MTAAKIRMIPRNCLKLRTLYGPRADIVKTGYFRKGLALRVSQLSDFFFLLRRQRRPAAPYPTALARCGQAFTGPFGDPLTFKLSDGCEDVKDERACWRRCINIFAQGSEACLFGFDDLNKLQQIFYRACQSIIFGDDDGVAGPKLIDQLVKLGSRTLCSANFIREYPFRRRSAHRFALPNFDRQ